MTAQEPLYGATVIGLPREGSGQGGPDLLGRTLLQQEAKGRLKAKPTNQRFAQLRGEENPMHGGIALVDHQQLVHLPEVAQRIVEDHDRGFPLAQHLQQRTLIRHLADQRIRVGLANHPAQAHLRDELVIR